ncbi:Dehydrodolichyl diphosphate syntase complex subunit SPAC4D7.04c [Grifola frondosa]|uniref:Dehydrodolichyl diphosphate syntase complex subunit SPAC4D7.04c n=1 Tax=Grifola frondosa TaxID=5627 RepID=A0A1C7LWN7_GRIFR|nr:Dehydrodolichyl diphosphate syntase complex subunit SPAC4D7.04c [Grifola frondosa]
MTRLNDKAILNICMPYSSRDDITTAVQSIVKDASGPESEYREITEDDIDAHLMTSVVGSPPVDILIRTSGVKLE